MNAVLLYIFWEYVVVFNRLSGVITLYGPGICSKVRVFSNVTYMI
jgi:hypothetical protein